MKSLEQIKADNRPKRKPTKPRAKKRGRTVRVGGETGKEALVELARLCANDWRDLAIDAIKEFRRVAECTDDQIRAASLAQVSSLEHRMSKLAGQLELSQ